MTDIFLSYARADIEVAQALARRLEQEGWSVWWDRRILPGQSFDDVIEEALLTAKCIIVLWSEHSVESDWVKSEAAEGRQRGNLIPALIEEVQIPLEFRRLQTANLAGWQSATQGIEFSQFLEAIRSVIPGSGPSLITTPKTEASPEPPGIHPEAIHIIQTPKPTDSQPQPTLEQPATEERSPTKSPADTPNGTETSTQEIRILQTPQSASPKGKSVAEPPAQVDIKHFLAQSYEAWQSGQLSGFSPNYEQATKTSEREALINYVYSTLAEKLNAIVNRTASFTSDEFLAGWGSSFVLTNRNIYFFVQSSAKGPITPIRINDIKGYRGVTRWRCTAEIDLNNGEHLVIKRLLDVPKEEAIEFLEHLNKTTLETRRAPATNLI